MSPKVVQEAPGFTRVDALRWLSFWLGGRYGLTVNDVDPSESVLASFTCPDDVEAYVSQLAEKYGLERVR